MSNNTIESYSPASSMDPINDLFLIYQNGTTSYRSINRNNVLGVTGTPADLSTTQTFTNKTLTSPTISSPTFSGTITGTYTLGGTPTFPSTVITTTATQTMTNKTLTSPTINSPTITNASITTDSIAGYTSSTSGSIYGISVSSSVITGANSIGTGTIVQNGVAASQLATSAIKLFATTITSNTTVSSATLAAFATAVSITFTVPAGGRDIKLTISGTFAGATTGDGYGIGWYESTTLLGNFSWTQPVAAYGVPVTWTLRVPAPSAGSHTYNLYGGGASATTLTLDAGAAGNSLGAGPFTILVEAI